MKVYSDHDGTASHGDIGQDYLCRFLGMDKKQFIEAVYEMRSSCSDPVYRDRIKQEVGCDHDIGLELGIMLAQKGVLKGDVEECGRDAHNSIREGFLKYLASTPDELHILSAGPADWLRPFWGKYSDKVNVFGTELYTGPDGEYRGIKLPCGKSGKPKVIMPARDLVCIGDSDGDSGMFDFVRRCGGFTIGIGHCQRIGRAIGTGRFDAHASIVSPNVLRSQRVHPRFGRRTQPFPYVHVHRAVGQGNAQDGLAVVIRHERTEPVGPIMLRLIYHFRYLGL